MLAGRVLRSGDRPGAEQEIWALLAACQLLRMAMTDAAQSRPGTDPDRVRPKRTIRAVRRRVADPAFPP